MKTLQNKHSGRIFVHYSDATATKGWKCIRTVSIEYLKNNNIQRVREFIAVTSEKSKSDKKYSKY